MDRSSILILCAGALLMGAGLDTFALVAAPVRQVEFPSEDKLKVTADLYDPRGPGAHGSRALWTKTPGHEEYRTALFAFLDSFRWTRPHPRT